MAKIPFNISWLDDDTLLILINNLSTFFAVTFFYTRREKMFEKISRFFVIEKCAKDGWKHKTSSCRHSRFVNILENIRKWEIETTLWYTWQRCDVNLLRKKYFRENRLALNRFSIIMTMTATWPEFVVKFRFWFEFHVWLLVLLFTSSTVRYTLNSIEKFYK